MINGIACTSLSRTVFDLAGTEHFPEALAVADAALRFGLAPSDLPAGGRASARRALVTSHASPFRESYLESYGFARIIQLGLPQPELQPKLLDSNGTLLGRGDLLWRDQGVIGEIDGATKYSGAYGKSPDQAILEEKNRHQDVESDGWVVVRWGYPHMRDHQRGFADRISAALARGAALPSPRSRILTPADPEWHEWHGSLRSGRG